MGREREDLKELSSRPHLAATKRDEELVELLKKTWRDAGLDRVDTEPYRLHLSWPDRTDPNKAYLLDGEGGQRFVTTHVEEEVATDDDFVHAFNAYALAGDVTVDLATDVVYVNYATKEDMEELQKRNVDLTGKVAIARSDHLGSSFFSSNL